MSVLDDRTDRQLGVSSGNRPSFTSAEAVFGRTNALNKCLVLPLALKSLRQISQCEEFPVTGNDLLMADSQGEKTRVRQPYTIMLTAPDV